MICPICHSENKDNVKFCSECGTPLYRLAGNVGVQSPPGASSDAPWKSASDADAPSVPSPASPETNPSAAYRSLRSRIAPLPYPSRYDLPQEVHRPDFSGLDKYLVDPLYVPNTAFHQGDTMQMPPLAEQKNIMQRQYRASHAQEKGLRKLKTKMENRKVRKYTESVKKAEEEQERANAAFEAEQTKEHPIIDDALLDKELDPCVDSSVSEESVAPVSADSVSASESSSSSEQGSSGSLEPVEPALDETLLSEDEREDVPACGDGDEDYPLSDEETPDEEEGEAAADEADSSRKPFGKRASLLALSSFFGRARSRSDASEDEDSSDELEDEDSSDAFEDEDSLQEAVLEQESIPSERFFAAEREEADAEDIFSEQFSAAESAGIGAFSREYRETSDGDNTKQWKKVCFIVAILLCGAISIAAGITYFLELWGGKVVPNVVGMTQADAVFTLEGKGFAVQTMDAKSDDVEGIVLFTDPAAGLRKAEGSEVTIHVSKARIVPDIEGLSLAEAQALLDEEGFTAVSFEEERSMDAPDTVLSVEPEAGTKAKADESITVVISVPFTVPDVTDMTEGDATAALNAAGYHVEYTFKTDDSLPERTVLGTEPQAGEELAEGSSVQLVLSRARSNELVELTRNYLSSVGSVTRGGITYPISSIEEIVCNDQSTTSFSVIVLDSLGRAAILQGYAKWTDDGSLSGVVIN